MTMQLIDKAEALELWGDSDGHLVRFQGDNLDGGNSLFFAYHEHHIYCHETGEEELLDPPQMDQVALWFEEYEE